MSVNLIWVFQATGNVPYGSTAEVQHPISLTTANGAEAAVISVRIHDSRGPESARSGVRQARIQCFQRRHLRLKPKDAWDDVFDDEDDNFDGYKFYR